MILHKNRYLSLLTILFLFSGSYLNPVFSQADTIPSNRLTSIRFSRQDTAREIRKRNLLRAEEPDTNFTYEKYAAFLKSVSDTSKFIVLTLEEFRTTLNPNKIVIGLRHDLDNDLNHAFNFSETESDLGFRSTYYILHTAPYYLENPNNVAVHTTKILPVLKTMQNERHFEIGLHNDLVTLQAVYKIDPVQFLHDELSWLRANGINIKGTASHGSPYCYTYKYVNFYFFEECTYPSIGQFVNNVTLPLGGLDVPMKKGRMGDFNLNYEAYFLNNNKYFSDASITAGVRWNIGMLDPGKLVAGDRVILLLHPIHWHKASLVAEIESFHIEGEESSVIDHLSRRVSVQMPYGTKRTALPANFSVSPGAQAKVSGKLQNTGGTLNDYSAPLTYRIYAENRKVHKEWTIDVYNAKNSACEFKSFTVPGFTGTITVDPVKRIVHALLNENPDLSMLQIGFELSPGARVYAGGNELFSNLGYFDFTNPIMFEVLAEDNITTSEWIVSVSVNSVGIEDSESAEPGMSVYPNPSAGMITMHFRNITVSQVSIHIYNALGTKVYSENVNKSGSFTVYADLTGYPAGLYLINYSDSAKPVKILISDD